jgi:ATP-dependent 26S proteasome regulatory subunit
MLVKVRSSYGKLFSEAHSHAASGKPSIIFIDEIDSICPRRNDKYVSKVMAHY